MRRPVDLPVLALASIVCLCAAPACEAPPDRVTDSRQSASIDGVAEGYVKLVLAIGHHDADYVDAYYGPPEWRSEVEAHQRTLAEIASAADDLRGALADLTLTSVEAEGDEPFRLRHEYLRRQLEALQVRVRMLSGETLTFDEESRGLYDAVAPTQPLSYFEQTRAELGQLLPGPGTLIERYEAFRQDFVIPADQLSKVFDQAIAECRHRTAQHVDLPAGESFSVEYVTDKSWSGYNWYQGDFRSLIQVNTDFPIFIDRAIDLACHEGYPGAPRLQRSAGAAFGTRPRLARVFGLCIVLAAVAHRRGHGELRHRRRVSGRRATRVRARRAVPGGRFRSGAGHRVCTRAGSGRPTLVCWQRSGPWLPGRHTEP